MEAKKKTTRKSKKENEIERGFWSAFDERLWGPTKTKALLKDMFELAEQSELLSIEGLQVHFGVNRTTWKELIAKYDWFEEGVEHLRRVFYEKRLTLVAHHDKAPALLKDLFRYSSDFCDDDFKYQDRLKQADHERRKELVTISKDEGTPVLESMIKTVMRDSLGNAYLAFGGPQIKEEQCHLTPSPTSTNSNHTGTNNES